MSEFLSEDDTKTFEGWLRLQGYADPAALAPTVLADFRDYYETYCNKPHPKVGRAPYAPKNPGDRHYAVAVQDAGELFVVLWVKRVLWKKKEFFVLVPRADAKSGRLVSLQELRPQRLEQKAPAAKQTIPRYWTPRRIRRTRS